MLLAEGDECRLFREGVDGSGVAVELTAISEGANHAPAVRSSRPSVGYVTRCDPSVPTRTVGGIM